MMSLPAMSLGIRFCVSRKGGTGGSGWVHPKSTNSMAASGLVFRSDLDGTGRAISIPEFKACFQLQQVGISRET